MDFKLKLGLNMSNLNDGQNTSKPNFVAEEGDEFVLLKSEVWACVMCHVTSNIYLGMGVVPTGTGKNLHKASLNLNIQHQLIV